MILFGGRMFHSRTNNTYGISNGWAGYINDGYDAIAVDHDVFDAVITNIGMMECLIIPEVFMMRHGIRGHVAAKLRYQGRTYKMKIKMCHNKYYGIFGDWCEFINENGLVMFPVIEGGVEVMKTVKLMFRLHTKTIRHEYALVFDVY
uniref:uncharacterized protein LOC122585816 n=1 Tax=Erigeron canadensis TaxID=72917 RepID=UPI001CB96E57|nr:uncharacterized protein LOC122585816 [Erigeron canadensis]